MNLPEHIAHRKKQRAETWDQLAEAFSVYNKHCVNVTNQQVTVSCPEKNGDGTLSSIQMKAWPMSNKPFCYVLAVDRPGYPTYENELSLNQVLDKFADFIIEHE